MAREAILEARVAALVELGSPLPIFAYGTLQGEGMQRSTGSRAILLGRFVARGLVLGMGDKYPCVDMTFDANDSVLGEGLELCDKSPEAFEELDEYEGVNGGYYQRRIIFASPEGSRGLFIPMWIYLRGEKLRNE